jgi:hypothetical protein
MIQKERIKLLNQKGVKEPWHFSGSLFHIPDGSDRMILNKLEPRRKGDEIERIF